MSPSGILRISPQQVMKCSVFYLGTFYLDHFCACKEFVYMEENVHMTVGHFETVKRDGEA